MFIVKENAKTQATAKQIWSLWEDVEGWKQWDLDLEESSIEGPFKKGVKGILKFKNSPYLKTILTSVEPGKAFVQEAKIFGARVVMTQLIFDRGDHREISCQIDIKGPLAFFFAKLQKESMKKKLPQEIQEMVKLAEKMGTQMAKSKSSNYGSFKKSPGFLLWQVGASWRRAVEKELYTLGLTYGQFVILAGVAKVSLEKEPMSQIEIAKYCGTNITMTSQILRTLEGKGYTERRQKAGDERSKFPQITSKGKTLIAKAIPLVEEVDKTFFGTKSATSIHLSKDMM